MKRKTGHIKYLIGSLTMILMIMFSLNSVFAQCGIYFKTKHRALNKGVMLGDNGMRLNDWTGDGKSDFWISRQNPNGTDVELVIYPSKATGYWDWDNPIVYATNFPSLDQLRQPAIIRDFNSDQRLDVLIGNKIYKNNGNGSLLAQTALPEPIQNRLVDLTDLNNDGLLDLINFSDANGPSSTIGYSLGNADGSFGQRVAVSGDLTIVGGGKTTGDFNGDGRLDIAYSTSGGVGTLLNMGNGTFTAGVLTADNHSHYFSLIGNYSPQNRRMENVGDFNNDGKDDILTKSQASDKLFILYGQSNGSFSETELPLSSAGTGVYRAVELNGDNNPDVIVFKYNDYSVYLNNGSGGFPRTAYRRSLLSFTEDIRVEDFSGDNKADFFDAGTYYEFMPLNAFGEPVTYIQENVCQSAGETKRLNFDGNYYSDLVFWNSSNGSITALDHGVFTGGTTTSYSFGSNVSGDVPSPGDYDGDGKTDAAIYRNSTGNWIIKRSSDGLQTSTQWGLTGDIAVPNDYDGGGKTDIAIWRPGDGGWWVLSTETGQYFAVQFGLNGDKPVPADYDGDGKTDIAVYRPSTGVWYYIRSSDGGVVIFQWGISTDKPMPADYDGDGKADATVYRDGDWYILRSSNNSFGFVHWGTATDIPVPRHWNDSLVGITVYRHSNGFWYQSIRHPGYIGFSQSGSNPVYAGLPNN